MSPHIVWLPFDDFASITGITPQVHYYTNCQMLPKFQTVNGVIKTCSQLQAQCNKTVENMEFALQIKHYIFMWYMPVIVIAALSAQIGKEKNGEGKQDSHVGRVTASMKPAQVYYHDDGWLCLITVLTKRLQMFNYLSHSENQSNQHHKYTCTHQWGQCM